MMELVSDKDHKPIRLDDMDNYDCLWSEEAQTQSQLLEVLTSAELISRQLFDSGLVKRKIIQSQVC